MDIKIKVEGVPQLMKQLDPQKVITASKRAIKRATESGKTEVSKQVREKFNINKADIDKKIGVNLHNLDSLQGELDITGQPISLMHFKPEQIKAGIKTFIREGLAQRRVKGKPTGGVKVKILRRGKPALLTKSFMALGRGNVGQVFRRITGTKSPTTGKEKLAVRKLVSYPSIVKQPWNMTIILAKIKTVLMARLHHEINRAIKNK